MSRPAESDQLKSCCAAVYQSDFARMLLGDSFHPGGLRLTERLGELLELGPGCRVLDVGSGKGESAIFLAQRFGCEVVGVDFGPGNIEAATERARFAGVESLARFQHGDAERLELPGVSFDAVICECAFCTFPNKRAAAAEFFRVLKPGGRVGLSDLTRSAVLPPELDSLLAWVACIADARPVEEYVEYLATAGMGCVRVEPHDEALSEMVRSIQGKLLGAEMMIKLNAVSLEGVDLAQAKSIARAAADAVHTRRLGYALITGQRS